METKLENILRMFRTTNNFCTGNPVVTGLQALDDSNDALAVKIQSIVTASQRQAEIITGITVEKNEKKDVLAGQAFAVAGAVMAYSTSVNNQTLFASVNYNTSDLKRADDQELEQMVNNITTAATNNLAALAPFGITNAVMTALADAKTAYLSQSTLPRQAIASRKHYTDLLATLFRETSKFLKNQMDKIVYGIVAQTNPDFAGEYHNMRRILDLGHTSTSIKFKIVNSETGLPEVHTAILNETEIETKNTDNKGKASFTKQTPDQPHLFTITKPGFGQKQVSITPQSGEIVHEIIELTPISQ